jgi:hypothetical protein
MPTSKTFNKEIAPINGIQDYNVFNWEYDESVEKWVPQEVSSSSSSSSSQLEQPSRLDSFGRQRVSEPYTIFDSKQIADKGDLFYSEVTGAGLSSIVYNSGDSSSTLAVSGAGSYSIRQTKMRFNYQPGKSQQFFETFVLGDIQSGVTARIGYFNTSDQAPYTGNRDGIFLERDSSGYSLNIEKSNGTNTEKIYQTGWNIDPFDGSGPSAATIDFSKVQIFHTDFEWLGVGSVRAGFVYNGELYYAHQFNHANIADSVYMTSPNHSVRYEIYSDGPEDSLEQICASVQSEGGLNPVGVSVGVSTNGTSVAIGNGTDEVVLAVRLKENALDTTVISQYMSVLGAANANFEWFICMNPEIAGESYVWEDVPNSALQKAVSSGSMSITDRGAVLADGYSSREVKIDAQNINTVLHLGCGISGDRDVFALGCRGLGGTQTAYAAMNFLELNLG